MNIEQIKKEWVAHCKEYNVKALCMETVLYDNSELINLHIKEHLPNVCNISIHNKKLIGIATTNQYYKLFTTFYEKLMEQEDE